MKQCNQIVPEIQEVSAYIKPTLGGVLHRKFLEWVEKRTVKAACLVMGERFALLAIILSILFPRAALAAIVWAFTAGSFAMVKIIVAVTIFKNRKDMFRRIRAFRTRQEATVEGVPVPELLHFLFQSKAFKFTEATDKFGISRRQYDSLAGHLESSGILIRGKDNARVLNPEILRQEAVEIIANGFQKPIRIFREGKPATYSKEELENEMPGLFQVRKVC